MQLSSEERELLVEVGHHLARVMWQNLGGSDPTYQAVMWDGAESVYEHGCAILQELGVFRSEGPGNYRFALPLEEVRDHLRRVTPETAYGLDRIIGTFLWATAGYQGDVSDERTPFEVPGHLQQALWAFVKLGYATREPQGFQWSDRIAPIMIAESLWDSEGRSLTTQMRRTAEELAERIWAAIPLWRRHLLARWIVGRQELDLAVYVFRRWDGERLRLFELPKGKLTLPLGHRDALRGIAERLIALRRTHPF